MNCLDVSSIYHPYSRLGSHPTESTKHISQCGHTFAIYSESPPAKSYGGPDEPHTPLYYLTGHFSTRRTLSPCASVTRAQFLPGRRVTVPLPTKISGGVVATQLSKYVTMSALDAYSPISYTHQICYATASQIGTASFRMHCCKSWSGGSASGTLPGPSSP